ncbi:MAG: L-lactate dehydrogenase [Clostridiales bacterium]|nr:L-lactate dehydrogenase [Clostridiales bacterium]MDY4201136.1 L-lactate dehydrogenase [Candidatus Fimadaptatus sp.]
MANRKITVIGAGSVGATTAFALTLKNIANEVVLVDINESKALGEAMDIRQSTPLLSDPVNVYAGNYESAAGSDIVVITSGMPRKPGQTRIDLAQTNVNIIKQIAPQIVKTCPDATYVIVSNPVDILTYVFHKVTDIPSNRIIGTGTQLDTARLRARIAEYLSVSQKNVHAYVFGEHGETSFIPWSIAEVSTVSLFDCKDKIKLDEDILVDLDYAEIERHMRSSGAKVIERKGCTNYAISVAVCSICDALFGAVNAVQTVSLMLNGEYGISDVCLSMPALIGNGVVRGRITPVLTDEELAKLHYSADALKKVLSQMAI